MILLQLIRYLAYFPIAVIGSLIGIVFAPVIALFVDSNGNLPYLLKYWETVDSTMFDPLWKASHPSYSNYMLAMTWSMRNPFYGGCYSLLGNKGKGTIRIYGNPQAQEKDGISGFFFYLADNGVYQFKIITKIPFTNSCVISESGWQIKDTTHPTFGSYELAPIRFQPFGKQ